ncbi:hypothetical protein LA6_001448 [Marinibacterium anthonyi]|nr:hypothetical protein LA6_001448 [Marinibacterium anthonyi]
MFLKPFLYACAATLAAGAVMASDAANVQQSSSQSPLGIYATGSRDNYCPAGLQPVTVDGTTSCGTPNRSGTYDEARRTPYGGHGTARYDSCAPGIKGCY